jgi:glycosyltransferase involved in cell wall biosynthesis
MAQVGVRVKVLFNTYPMAFHTPGGGEIQLLQYRQFLPRQGVDVALLNLWKPEFGSHDLLHFSCMSGSVHFCAFAKSIGLPLVVSPNLWITEENRGHYPFDEIRTQFVLADRVIGNSDMECDLLARVFNMPRERFSTVYNGVNDIFCHRVDPALFRSQFAIDGPFVLNVANIEARKNQLGLARAMKQHPDMKLVLIGHQRDPAYAAEVMAAGEGQVIYLGPLPHDSILLRSAYAACEVFALPSTLETPGLAALEACAIGARIVVTGEGSTREYFGVGAVYVDPSDMESIASGVTQAMQGERCMTAAMHTRANYTWQRASHALASVYNELVDGGTQGSPPPGFNPVEQGPFAFAWAEGDVKFDWSAGELFFFLHALTNATVEFLVDGVTALGPLNVGPDWTHHRLEIVAREGVATHQVQLRVNAQTTAIPGDPRKLAVAIGRVEFRPAVAA